MSQSSMPSSSQGWRKNNYGGSQSQNQNRPPCANPVIEQWLMEWKEEAIQKNSKMQFVYGKALASLRKYPLPLGSGKECKLLEFFGNTLCKMIDLRISKEGIYLPNSVTSSGTTPEFLVEDSPTTSPKPKKKRTKKPAATTSASAEVPIGGPTVLDLTQSDNDEGTATAEPVQQKKTKAKGRQYIPSYRSGAYALLLALAKKEGSPGYRGYMLKTELLSEAQQYCDSSFTRSEVVGGKYTAWNSMSILINKDLVFKEGTPAKYLLTEEGRERAAILIRAENGGASANGVNDDSQSQSCGSQAEDEPVSNFVIHPGDFEIILYVDTGETTAKHKDQELIGELKKNGINLEVSRLAVGDFVWVCRSKAKENQNRRLTVNRINDLILPYVVERKRADDLAGSIKDGRFYEQKLRLSQTGLHVIYLIEALESMRGNCGLGDGALTQAMANTQVVNNFMIQETTSIKDTCSYLTHMTRLLTKIYASRSLTSCGKEDWPKLKDSLDKMYMLRFSDFNEFAVKQRNWSIKEMFAKHLLRMRGLSVERAFAIVEKYPSPQALLRGYSQMETEKEKELMLSGIFFGNMGKTIGPAISRAIYKLYKSNTLT